MHEQRLLQHNYTIRRCNRKLRRLTKIRIWKEPNRDQSYLHSKEFHTPTTTARGTPDPVTSQPMTSFERLQQKTTDELWNMHESVSTLAHEYSGPFQPHQHHSEAGKISDFNADFFKDFMRQPENRSTDGPTSTKCSISDTPGSAHHHPSRSTGTGSDGPADASLTKSDRERTPKRLPQIPVDQDSTTVPVRRGYQPLEKAKELERTRRVLPSNVPDSKQGSSSDTMDHLNKLLECERVLASAGSDKSLADFSPKYSNLTKVSYLQLCVNIQWLHQNQLAGVSK